MFKFTFKIDKSGHGKFEKFIFMSNKVQEK